MRVHGNNNNLILNQENDAKTFFDGVFAFCPNLSDIYWANLNGSFTFLLRAVSDKKIKKYTYHNNMTKGRDTGRYNCQEITRTKIQAS